MKLLFTFIWLTGMCFGQSNEEQPHKTVLQNIGENDPLRVDELSQELIRLFSQTNSCYLPLLKDPDLHQKGSKVGFEWTHLFNNSLAEDSQYKN